MGTTESKQLVADAFARWEKGEGTAVDVVAEEMRWTITGTSKVAGTWTSKAALDGVGYDNEYCWVMRVDGGQVVEVVAWFDSHTLDGLIDRVPLPA